MIAASSISCRYSKKLTAKTYCYKQNKKRKYEMDEEEQGEMRVGQEQKKAKKPTDSERKDDKNTDKNSCKIVCIHQNAHLLNFRSQQMVHPKTEHKTRRQGVQKV